MGTDGGVHRHRRVDRTAQELGDRSWRELLGRHDRLAEALARRFRGRVVKHLDGHLTVFESPEDTIRFADSFRTELGGVGLAAQRARGRMGALRRLGHMRDTGSVVAVRIEPWAEGDLPLLEKTLGDPAMTKHIGGPESPEKIAERQTRYELPDSRQFKVIVEATGEAIGWVGYWDRTWREQLVYEVGWSVVPGFQGRGIAGLATAQLIDVAKAEQRRRFLHAFPSVHNAPSNAICRMLGFELLGAMEFEYPPGSFMLCNDWRLDLFASI